MLSAQSGADDKSETEKFFARSLSSESPKRKPHDIVPNWKYLTGSRWFSPKSESPRKNPLSSPKLSPLIEPLSPVKQPPCWSPRQNSPNMGAMQLPLLDSLSGPLLALHQPRIQSRSARQDIWQRSKS